MNRYKFLGVIFLVLMVAFLSLGCQSDDGVVEDDGAVEVVLEKIVIGVVEPISGPMAPLGTAEWRAIQLAVEMINEKGGVMGQYPVEVIFADSESNPGIGASEAERLITMHNVPVILGSYSSAIAMAISEVAERNQVVLWEMSGTSDDLLKRGYEWTYRTESQGSSWGAAGADFAADIAPGALGKDISEVRVAIIHEDGPYGAMVSEGSRVRVAEHGMNLVMDEGYTASALDLSDLVMSLRRAEPDVLLQTSYVADAILLMRQMKELGFTVPMLVTHSGGHSVQAFVEGVGVDANYIATVDPTPCNPNVSAFTPELQELWNEFVERWTALYGFPPYHHVEHRQFAQTMILLEEVLPVAIQKYGGVTSENIRYAIWDLDIPEGGSLMGHPVKFATPEEPWTDPWLGNEHIGQNIYAHAFINQWIDGMLHNVWPPPYNIMEPVAPLPAEHPLAPR